MSVAFFRPRTVKEAVAYLQADEDARLLAGGQTLVATIAMGIYKPSAMVTLLDIEELRGIRRTEDGKILIGSMTTHSEIAESDLFTRGQSVVPSAAGQIASMAVRNFGTIGGSCAHADPASDWPSALVAASAVIHVCGPKGSRSISAESFFQGFLTSALAECEVITSIEVPALPGRGLHLKLARVAGDYATVSVSVVIAAEGANCVFARFAIGSFDAKPVRAEQADSVLIGGPVNERRALEVGCILRDAGSPLDDVRGSANYRRRVLPALVARAALEALA